MRIEHKYACNNYTALSQIDCGVLRAVLRSGSAV